MRTLYRTRFIPYIIIAAVSLVSTIILWLPFILHISPLTRTVSDGISFDTVVRHWDGPLYIIPAKSWYNINHPVLNEYPLGLEKGYFAEHLPGYPLTIRAAHVFFDYPKATIIATLLTSIVLFIFFFEIVRRLKLTNKPLLLTLIFMFITPRFFVVRSVGAPEPLFILGIFASLFFFAKKRYFLAGLTGMIAIITKTPAILLFGGYALYFIKEFVERKRFEIQSLYLLLIPAGLLGVFTLYHFQYGDFFMYFNNGISLNLNIIPFQTFNASKNWIGTAWLEDILYIYVLYGYTVIELFSRSAIATSFFSKIKSLITSEKLIEYSAEQLRFFQGATFFSLCFFLAIISINHRDVSRYSLPLLPIMLITFEKFFTSKKFVILLIILLPAIYMYAWNFMLENVMPNADWTHFL